MEMSGTDLALEVEEEDSRRHGEGWGGGSCGEEKPSRPAIADQVSSSIRRGVEL